VLGVGQFRKALGHSQDKQDGGVTSNRYAGIALFHLGQGGARDRSAFRGDFGRNPPPAPCILYIVAELTQGTADGKWQQCCGLLFAHI
jgi:hypothetical protein